MPTTIQVVSVGCDLYGDADRAARRLTESQADFEFRLPPLAIRDRLSGFRFDEYRQKDAIERLKAYASEPDVPAGVGTIGLVRGGLQGNLFAVGDTSAQPYCAIVTTNAFDRYTPSLQVYLAFYFVRWALKFLCPSLASHADPRGCVLDRRKDKRRLIEVLEYPRLCDDCMSALQPQLGSDVKIASIDSLLDIIKEENARTKISTVILKGGGVKGAALAGAVSVLMDKRYQRYYAPRTFVGTSAGAIVAAFLVAGLDPPRLTQELDRDFRSLLDPLFKWPWNLLHGAGLHSGKPIEEWVEAVLRSGSLKRSGAPQDPVRFSDIRESDRRLVVYAANRYGTLPFDSAAEPSRPVATAVRFSMSIPLFFTTLDHDGDEVFDGGLLNNYPVEAFRRNPRDAEDEFVAIYLSSGDRPADRAPFLLLRLLSILLNRDEFVTVRQFRKATILVDCSPVGTVDFSLSGNAKRLLENRGRLAALTFVAERGWDDAVPLEAERQRLKVAIAQDLIIVEREGKRRQLIRRVALGLLAAVTVTGLYFLFR